MKERVMTGINDSQELEVSSAADKKCIYVGDRMLSAREIMAEVDAGTELGMLFLETARLVMNPWRNKSVK
jgi:type III secretory pathway component EscU